MLFQAGRHNLSPKKHMIFPITTSTTLLAAAAAPLQEGHQELSHPELKEDPPAAAASAQEGHQHHLEGRTWPECQN